MNLPAWLAVATIALPRMIAAQAPGEHVRGVVVHVDGGTPLPGAVVRSVRGGQTVRTNQVGAFTIRVALPDTLVVRLVGFRPDTVVVPEASGPLRIALRAVPAALSDLVVPATDEHAGAGPLGWRLGAEALRAAPFALEPDVLRALAAVPAVSFSSPLSARPIIRGYGPSESSIQIDGHDVHNPYHLARSFFVFPPDAAESVTLSPGPPAVTSGSTLSGVVAVNGRSAVSESKGGGTLGLGSVSGWAGGGSGTTWFASGRGATLSVANALVGTIFPYTFGDFYGSVSRPGRLRLTAFATRDHLGKRAEGTGGDWGTVLVGGDWTPWSRGGHRLSVVASANHAVLDASAITVRRSTVDVRNRLGRLLGGVRYDYRTEPVDATVGASVARHRIENRVAPLAGGDFPSRAAAATLEELSGYATVATTVDRCYLRLGVRVDASPDRTLLQPRGELGWSPSAETSVGVAFGRTSRLYQMISSQISEPELDFADFWLQAGRDGVPVPRVDHLAADFRWRRGAARLRIGVFGSAGRWLGELIPVPNSAGELGFRFGRSRTVGVEAQVGVADREVPFNSVSVGYVLGRSERDFDGGWMRWGLDRTHLLRFQGQRQLGRRIQVSLVAEAASGLPFTPVAAIVYRRPPGAPGGFAFPAYLLGGENSARGAGTFRIDVSAQRRIDRFLGGSGWLGASLTNVGFGPVAPERAVMPTTPTVPGVPYERLYKLPVVPAVFLRLEF